MKSSDVVARHERQPAIDAAATLKLVQQNDTHADVQVDWRRTHIGSTRGAAESAPYACDAAITAFDHRKKLHKVLDAAMEFVGFTADQREVRALHAMLDEALDGEEKRKKVCSESELASASAADSGSDVEHDHCSKARDSGRRCFARDDGNLSLKEYEKQERAKRMRHARPL